VFTEKPSFHQTGFEFKKRRALPVIEGVVVAAEHEAVLLEVSREAPCIPTMTKHEYRRTGRLNETLRKELC
jgi:xeroderma pigmentosum group C-complementing protein